MVALVALAHPRWYPFGDLAQTELRLRDVGSRHAPLIGLAGRIGTLGPELGSHPGPLSFFGMWPFYRLFGASAWGMEAAAAVLDTIAIALALWIASRRGGAGLVCGTAAVLAVVLRAYGTERLLDPWNPHLPVLWWLVFVLAVWAVVCNDLPMLPLVAFAGSFCVQTHISYVALTVGLGLLAVGWSATVAYRRRRGSDGVRDFARWALLAASVGIVAWIPPVIDEFAGSGNLSKSWRYFAGQHEALIGLARGLELLLIDLNPWRLLTAQLGTNKVELATGSVVPGIVLLAIWAATATIAVRLRCRALLRLNLVLAVALVVGVISVSRIFGDVWSYLILWVWGINALVLLSIGWTAAISVGRYLTRTTRQAAQRRRAAVSRAVLAALAILSTAAFSIEAAHAHVENPRISQTLGRLVRPTIRALSRKSLPGGGREGRYLLTQFDPLNTGMQWGIVNELERQGFTAEPVAYWRALATPHRVIDPSKATAIMHLSFGADIAKWQSKAGVVEVARADMRNPEERVEYERLRSRVARELTSEGLSDLLSKFDSNSFVALHQRQVPAAIRRDMNRMVQLGLPVAVFVAPPEVAGQ